MIDVTKDKLFPVVKLIEDRIGKRISRQLLWRWRTKGVRGVKLETVAVGSNWYSTPEALGQFIRAQTEAEVNSPHIHEKPGRPKRSWRKKEKLRQVGLLK